MIIIVEPDVEGTSGARSSSDVSSATLNALLGRAPWEIWHFSGYMLASG